MAVKSQSSHQYHRESRCEGFFGAFRAQTTQRLGALVMHSSLVRTWWPPWTAASCSGRASTGQSLCRWVALVCAADSSVLAIMDFCRLFLVYLPCIVPGTYPGSKIEVIHLMCYDERPSTAGDSGVMHAEGEAPGCQNQVWDVHAGVHSAEA